MKKIKFEHLLSNLVKFKLIKLEQATYVSFALWYLENLSYPALVVLISKIKAPLTLARLMNKLRLKFLLNKILFKFLLYQP